MNKSALAFLQDLIRQALAKVHALEHVCDEGLFPTFTKVYLRASKSALSRGPVFGFIMSKPFL